MNYFLSDIHLKDKDDPNIKILCHFLDGLSTENCERVFLLGDIFDLWVADHKVFQEKFYQVINSIEALVKRGIEIHYFEGNHDLYLKKFWQDEIGVNVHQAPVSMKLGEFLVRMEHGDLSNPEDTSYLKYKAFLQTKLMNRLAFLLPGKLIDKLGNKASDSSREYEHHKKWDAKVILRKYIAELSKENGFDILITGHLHERIDEELSINNKLIRNINLGWWKEEKKVLKIGLSHIEWLDLKA